MRLSLWVAGEARGCALCGYSTMRDTHWKKDRHTDSSGADFHRVGHCRCQSAKCYASLISNGFTRPVCDSTQGRTGRASGTQSPIARTFNLPVPFGRVELDPTEIYEYEVLIFDQQRGRDLVAAIELVSPANRDRPETRQGFVSKCAALLQKKICKRCVSSFHFPSASFAVALL